MSKVYRCGIIAKDVGKKMSNTKKMVKWGLLIDDKRCVVTIKHSILSHKKMIWFNNEVVKETKQFLTGDFDYAWSAEKHIFKIVVKKDKGYAYSLFVDDINFFDLPDFKEKDKLETEDIVNRLKNGPIPTSNAEEAAEEEEPVEEIDVPEDEEPEEENEFFSNQGEDDNWLDFTISPMVTRVEETEEEKKLHEEEDKRKQEEERAREEEELKKKRVAEYTAGLVDLNLGF